MRRRLTGSRRLAGKKKIWAVAAVAAGSMMIQAGCVRQTDIPIVSEKTTGDQDGQEKKDKEESETGREGAKETAGLIREQTEAPGRYRLSIRGEDVTVTADVEVNVPETDKIFLKDVDYSPYTDEELEQIRDVLEEELGCEEQSEDLWNMQVSGEPRHQESSFNLYCASTDLTYTLDLRAGDGENLPVVWLSAAGVSDGTGGAGDVDDLSGCPMTEAEMGQIEAVLESKAEELLRKMNLRDFSLESARWRRLSVIENDSWTLSGQYGVRLYYSRNIEDLPLVNSEHRRGGLRPRSQYVEFLYREDGTLLTVKNIGRERIEDSSEYAGFLLPFSSVSQIFEQCMRALKIYGAVEAEAMGEAELRPAAGSASGEAYAGKKPHVYLTITDVKMAYGLEYGGRIQDMTQTYGQKGRLIPVWAFYGTVEQGYQNPDGTEAGIPRLSLNGGAAELILAVDGVNGTIYGEPLNLEVK